MPEKSSEQTRPNLDRAFDADGTAVGKLGTLWCGLMHDSAMWPMHGHYECRTCGRIYPVAWAGNQYLAPERIRQPHLSAPRLSVLPPLIIMVLALLSASTVHAAEPAIVDSTSQASLAFARYTAGLEEARPWNLETIEVDASLPKLAKHGRLRAIRRRLQFGKPEFQVLEIATDRTVRQVIVRYLSAEERAAAIPAASVAVTPANYKFRYKGSMQAGGTAVYIFQITPRKKREGLIKGELWLDGETGAAVRQSGYLVKQSSIFLKHVDVTRETALRDGVAEERITRLSVDTRLVGRAELTIHERPGTAWDNGSLPAIVE